MKRNTTKITTLSFILFLSISSIAFAKDFKYPCLLIPDSIKKDAYAVIRNFDTEINIVSNSKSIVTVTRAITILNGKGKKKAWELLPYSKHMKIISAEMRMYDQFGKQVEKWGKSDMEDVGFDSYGTAYSDTRALICEPIFSSYPYTIEFNFSYERLNTYSIDGWHPVWENNLAVQKSTLKLIYPQSVDIKYKEYNFGDSISKKETDGEINWEINNFTAVKSEPYGPSNKELFPYISIEANNFTFDNYTGSSSTWKDFGLFIAQLNKGRDELPIERKKEIDALTDTCTSVASKVNVLYKYMQSHTRYVNIAIGIGGIQTFPATHVSENGYGDCKALSNYMYSMLKYVGIPSYFTLVNAGASNYYFDPEYVSHQFNHAILCVPTQQDTIWLECTSQNMPCGFLGDFTDNRYVLLVTEEGGKLCKTPYYNKNQNCITRVSDVKLFENGDCKAQILAKYTGLEYDDNHRLTIEGKDEQKKILYSNYNIPNFIINDFNISTNYEKLPELNEEISMTLTKYASKSGARLFVPLNVASKWDFIPQKLVKRQFDIYKRTEYCYMDSVKFSLPENYSIEALPEEFNYSTKFGTYIAKTSFQDNELHYTRILEVNKGVFPAEEYNDFIEFFKTVQKNDGAIAIIKRQNQNKIYDHLRNQRS